MAKKKPMSVEERLKKKRECEKRRRERIKQSVEATEALKRKKHEIYLRLKSEGKVKMIDEMNQREQRIVRKKWKENTRKRREKVKIERQQKNACPTPPESEESALENVIDQHNENLALVRPESHQKTRGRKLTRKNKASCYRENDKLKREIEKLKRSRDKYKKRFYRGQKRQINENEKNQTPRKQVRQIIQRNKGKISKEVRRELLFAASIKCNLKEKYKSIRSQKEKQIFTKVIGGKILKKYRVLNQCYSFLPAKLARSNTKRLTKFSYERMKSSCQNFVKEKVQTFLESDENSRLCPGKRDVARKNGEVKQKRLLNGTLTELHEKFVKQNLNLSRALFYKLRRNFVWWVVKPNVNSRDTCLCQKHENLKLLIEKLHELKIIKENTTYDVVKALTCEEGENENCFIRQCAKCENKTINFMEFDGDIMTDYKEWQSNKENRISSKTKKEIIVKVVSKKNIQCTTLELVRKFQDSLNTFLLHEMKIKHQFLVIRDLKEKLTSKDLLIHIDFSENYLCKYESEVQSVHFGASRQQISLHTGVVYSKDMIQSFSTVSPILDHTAPAVMAHIKPVLDNFMAKKPEVENIHFLSDSVSAQYRNKTIFHFIQNRIPTLFPQIKSITWNYTEAGHGKGAPDGVGAVLKRTADEAVAQGKDVHNFEEFFDLLKKKSDKINLIQITEEMIEEEKRNVPDLTTMKGTMEVHQVCWLKGDNTMKFRRLSCFSDACKYICIFYHVREKSMISVQDPIDIEQEDIFDLKIGSFVAVAFTDDWYPGEIRSVQEEFAIISFMQRKESNRSHFKWPEKPDEARISTDEFMGPMSTPDPVPPFRMKYFTFKESELYDEQFFHYLY